MYTVYTDIPVWVSWIIDYLLLLGAAAATPISRRRLIFGSGAVRPDFYSTENELSAAACLSFCHRERYSGTAMRQSAVAFPCKGAVFLCILSYSGLATLARTRLSLTGIYRNNRSFYYDVFPVLLFGCVLVTGKIDKIRTLFLA